MNCRTFPSMHLSPRPRVPTPCGNALRDSAMSACTRWHCRIRAGVLPFFLNRFDATNSLLDNAQGPRSSQTELAEHVNRIEVQATTLDDWCAAVCPRGDLVIKADVQGAEGRVVAGGRRAFTERRVAAMYCEVAFAPLYECQTNFFELHETLTVKYGLALWQIYALSRDAAGRAAWGDALWLREDALASMWT